jgi:antitoxin HigA-1
MSKSLTTTKGIPLAPADVTPGDILSEEFLKPLGMSQTALAKRMRVDPMRINAIVRGKRAITAETAIRLASVFGTSARFWLGLQNDHDLAIEAQSRTTNFKRVMEAAGAGAKKYRNALRSLAKPTGKGPVA